MMITPEGKNTSAFKFDKERDDTGKTALLGRGFFVEVQPGIYQGYKPVLVEDPKTGEQTDTGQSVPFGKPCRRVEDGEPIIARTPDPETGNPIELTPLDAALRAGAIASKNYEIKGR
jgi:hypothetical protein